MKSVEIEGRKQLLLGKLLSIDADKHYHGTTMCLSEKARNELERLSAATTTDVDGDPNLQTPRSSHSFLPFPLQQKLEAPGLVRSFVVLRPSVN